MRPVLMIVATAALLAACTPSAEQAQPPASVPSSASTPTSSSQPTTTTRPALSKAQAARQYLQVVKPYNVALETLEKAANAGQPMSRLRQLAETARKATTAEMRALRATRWPSVVRADVRELATAIDASLADWRRATRAQTLEDLIKAVSAAADHGSAAARTIRARLQLDKYDEDDY